LARLQAPLIVMLVALAGPAEDRHTAAAITKKRARRCDEN
jgi:hypothetical protein